MNSIINDKTIRNIHRILDGTLHGKMPIRKPSRGRNFVNMLTYIQVPQQKGII
jgi:hypothetical protein